MAANAIVKRWNADMKRAHLLSKEGQHQARERARAKRERKRK